VLDAGLFSKSEEDLLWLFESGSISKELFLNKVGFCRIGGLAFFVVSGRCCNMLGVRGTSFGLAVWGLRFITDPKAILWFSFLLFELWVE